MLLLINSYFCETKQTNMKKPYLKPKIDILRPNSSNPILADEDVTIGFGSRQPTDIQPMSKEDADFDDLWNNKWDEDEDNHEYYMPF